MKISFKLLDGNRLASNNNKVLSQYIIDEAFLKRALSIINYEMIEKNHIFVVLPMNGKDSDYRVCDAFVVCRYDGSICIWLWSNQFINFEDGDVIFTTQKDAEAFAFELNSAAKNKKLQSETDKSIEAVESYLNKTKDLREKIAAYSKDMNGNEKLLFDMVINVINSDIKNHINALEQIKMLKRFSPFIL